MTVARARCLQVMVPEVPLAINLAYKCWSMERRRYRSAHDVKDTRYVGARRAVRHRPVCPDRVNFVCGAGCARVTSRDPREFVGAYEFEFPFQLRFTKLSGPYNIRVRVGSPTDFRAARRGADL